MSDAAIEVDVRIESANWRQVTFAAEAAARRAALATLTADQPPAGPGCETSLVLADDAFVAELNRTWRGREGPTNVLSFPGGDDGGHDGPVLLGDVVVAFETVAREAADGGRSLESHLSHMIVHGVLHLLGHDHMAERDAEEMEAMESAIMQGLGFSDPYSDDGGRDGGSRDGAA